tara:strand:- start:806 stop:1603 length:798 start_codon:yes stop_codon:yes gene_type:complete
MDHNALTRAGEMLHGLASDLSKEQPTVTGTVEETQAVKDAIVEGAPGSITAVEPAPAPAPAPAATTATEVFGDPKQPAAETATSAAETATPQAGSPTQNITTQTETVTPAPVATAPAGVEVDSDGLPWDHRIHALGAGGTHNKLKKTQQWKKKRGVDAALVAEVEAELRAAMSAGPANPVVTEQPAPAPAPAPAATTEQPAPAPAPAPAAVGGTTTFPALMAGITANGIDQAKVTEAVNAQGLTALPLLAARPDLIPAVAAALGV